MASPWEQTWSDVKQGAEEAVANVKTEAIRALPWLQNWMGDTQPSPAPVKPPVEAVKGLPNDSDGFWTNLKQKWHAEAPQRQAEITKIKQAEWGEELPAAVKNLESLLSKKNLDGTVRRILRTEYRDLTGKDYNSRIQAPPVKPLSGLQHDGVANPEVPSFVEAMGSVASRAGDKILDVAFNAGLGVNASAALATAGEMAADPLNLIPGGKGVAAVGAIAFKDLLKIAPDFAKSIIKEPVYHGSVNEIKGSFRLPKEGERQLGIHFGSKDAANAILNKDTASTTLQHNISEVYLNIKKPLVMEDQGIWRPKFVIEQLEKESLTPQQRVVLDQYKRNNPQAKEIYSNTSDQSVRKLLQDLGYDGVQYRNLHEGTADQWSYIVLDPKQIQSAISPKGVKVGAEKTVLPTVTNSIYSKFPGQALKDTKYVQRNVRESAELADMLKTGYLLPKPGGKSQKYFTAVDEVNPDVPAGNTMIRILRDKVKPTEPVSVKDVEVFNFKLGSWEPLVKGK